MAIGRRRLARADESASLIRLQSSWPSTCSTATAGSTGQPLRDKRTRLEDVVDNDLVLLASTAALDGSSKAWAEVVERGYEGYVPKDGWRATFYTTGMEHSKTSATGTAWESTPWRATPPGGGAL